MTNLSYLLIALPPLIMTEHIHRSTSSTSCSIALIGRGGMSYSKILDTKTSSPISPILLLVGFWLAYPHPTVVFLVPVL